MGGRVGQGRGRGVCGRCESIGRGRGISDYTPALNKNIFLCSALGNNFLNYVRKGAAYQIHNTCENIVHHFGTICRKYIRNKLQNKTKVSIPNPEYTEDVQLNHK